MRHRTLGVSGVSVSVLCLGTMTFGAEAPEDTSHRILDRYIDAGATPSTRLTSTPGGPPKRSSGIGSRAVAAATTSCWRQGPIRHERPQSHDNLGAADLELADKERSRLDELSADRPGYPYATAEG